MSNSWIVACKVPLSMEFSRQEYWGGQTFLSPGDLLNPGIEPRSPTLWADSLPAEPHGKPKNTGVGSLSLLQRIFLTQELNQDRLPCRWVLYQLSYEGSPAITWMNFKNIQKLGAKTTYSMIAFILNVQKRHIYIDRN